MTIVSTLVCVLLMIVGNVWILRQQFSDLNQAEYAQDITRLSANLLGLTQEYVLFKSPTAVQSWYATYDALTARLSSLKTTPQHSQDMDDFEQGVLEIKPIFNELIAIAQSADENSAAFQIRREQLIVDRLVTEAQVIVEMGHALSTEVNKQQRSALQTLVLITALGLGFFVVVIVLLVVLLRWGVLNSLLTLQTAANAIRSGDHSATCEVSGQDEIAEVAMAVNQMAQSLARQNEELRHAEEKAQLASRAKSDFLSTMSHEIRTPLNGIVGLSYLLKDTASSVNQRVLLESLEKTSRNLIDLVSDVLDISKIESGSMDLEEREFSVLDLLDKLGGLMSGAAAGKSLELIIDPSPDLPLQVVGDELRIRQMAVNLVGNAVKFTHQGFVRLVMEALEVRGQGLQLRMAVHDSGVGLAEEAKQHLFQKFSQAAVSVAREFGGSGLGLSLVKRLAELMGGRVGFDSRLGEGSCFWVEVPLRLPDSVTSAASPRRARDDMARRQLPVVLVSQSELQVQALRNVSRCLGRSLHVVADVSGLASQLPLIRSQFPEGTLLIIVDFEAHQGIRESVVRVVQSSSLGDVRFVMLAKGGDARDLLDQQLDDSVTAVVVKPLTPLQLQQLLSPAPIEPDDLSLAEQGQGLRVLIVDDSELNLKVLEGILKGRGYRTLRARHGLEAVSLLKLPDHGFDAVIMDVQMPLMDGLEATEHIRTLSFNARLPIIGLTGEVEPQDERRALQAGMDAVLPKPLQPDELLSTLAKLLHGKNPSNLASKET
ncbi:response regulator [Limnobacter humi]|uniref:histidine kinase n=1 Tax=Limnobacter humi TaxID=1778671 RepID=A0ABT1WHG3_9BURK|nr:response regulator [Limnobacter humi]MCQ8896950.1 response regulator [Limnobacter humi]